MSGPASSSVTAPTGRSFPGRVCVKQSQFPADRHQWPRAGAVAHAGTAGPKRVKQSQSPAATGADADGRGRRRGAVVGTACTNKANLPTPTERGTGRRSRRSGRLRQTNPICPVPAGKGTGGQGGTPCRHRGQARQTKPISSRATRGTSILWKKSYDKSDIEKGLGKTKPIPGRTPMGKDRQGCQCRRWDLSCETKPISRVGATRWS